MGATKSQKDTATVLDRIAWLSAHDPNAEFFSLMHHINENSLRDCYHKLDGKKAVGVDGVTKWEYGENLEENLEKLISRMKRLAYRPGDVREVLIAKEGKPGAKRPLGISNFEDKLVQKRTQELLEAIYDPLFIENSYGFRPKRGCHDAVKAVREYLHQNQVEVVIDVDLANFFGTIDHDLLTEMLREKIKDKRFIRYIRRMFKAGVQSNGKRCVSDRGVPQGNCASPVLANIFAHHVIDLWFNETVKRHTKGRVEMFRYADDLVIICQYDSDAKRVMKALKERLAKYKLKLNEEKTKVVRFSKRLYSSGVKQETFDFLGFTFYLGRSQKGYVIPKLKTSNKRFRSKLKELSEWMRENRNKYRLAELWRRVCISLRGHIQYYGVSFNSSTVQKFVRQVTRILFKWLNRRSQKRSFDWDKFNLYLKGHPLPKVRVYHKLF